MSDGPNGARGGDFYDGTTAACFPASVSLASTFNRSLSYRVGVALAQETLTKGAAVLLGPTVCAHRSPLGGRNFEAFSEDPFLSGTLAAEYVKGLQSERVGATLKHFVANEQDTRRFSINEKISERALRLECSSMRHRLSTKLHAEKYTSVPLKLLSRRQTPGASCRAIPRSMEPILTLSRCS